MATRLTVVDAPTIYLTPEYLQEFQIIMHSTSRRAGATSEAEMYLAYQVAQSLPEGGLRPVLATNWLSEGGLPASRVVTSMTDAYPNVDRELWLTPAQTSGISGREFTRFCGYLSELGYVVKSTDPKLRAECQHA